MVAEVDEAGTGRQELCFADQRSRKGQAEKIWLVRQLGEYFFPTIGVAVSRYLEINNVEWKD
jgi:hypothetical protein